MSDDGDEARDAFLEALEAGGGEYDAGGEKRRALRGAKKPDGSFSLSFAEEFPIKEGDVVRELATENYLEVVETESVPAGGKFNRFVVTVVRR